jgi:hypothetical protein
MFNFEQFRVDAVSGTHLLAGSLFGIQLGWELR